MVDSNEPGEIRDILEKLSQNKISLGKVWEQLRPYRWDLGGIAIITLSLMTLLAWLVPNLVQGSILLNWANLLRLGLGWGSLCLIGTGLTLGIWMLKQTGLDAPDIRWGRIFALEGAVFSLIAFLTVLGGHSLPRARAGLDGGLVGWGLVEAFSSLLGLFWTGVITFLGMITGVIIGLDLRDLLEKVYYQLDSKINDAPEDLPAPSGVQKISLAEPVQADVPSSASKKRRRLPPEFRKNFQVGAQEDKPISPPERDQRLPDLDLLITGKTSRPNQRHINTSAGLIEKTLAEFGIPAQVIGFQVGPTVTQFAVKPGYMNGAEESTEEEKKKVRVSKITSLKRDLALALSAKQLRIEAPVPGRAYIGIEVPNEKSSLVRLRPLLESEAFYKVESPLAIALGRDVSGEPVVADLATMPHLLIAGTTGSGKSVCITSLTTCLVMNNTPEDLRLVMIDPKMVELIRFNGLPHLYGKVETDLERILGVLQWVVGEMERRYQLLEETSSRNIDTYNRKMQSRKKSSTLPRIVVMIDELADLMMMAPGQTEHSLVRLAQMARATGIHLVVATQRPSTDVVTGLIKANFPARMSFAVASSVDSRVILDTGGAESLLGNGDMLFLPPEEGSPIRAQGCIVTKQELERVIKAWADQEVEEQDTPPWESTIVEQAAMDDYDELIKDAFEIVRDSQRASTSMLQRKLRVGYPRAARLMDDLSELGFVGPSKGSGQEREVFIAPDDEFEVED
ncbi:MAG: DNA translocase FtsK [Anaerolineales bacterium]|nr:DNA translocase FtsK [Anaerolineales bacterium]